MRMSHLLPRSVAAAALAALIVPAGASAAKPRDRDHDHMPDRWEVAHKLNSHRNDAGKDADRDGLKNLAEYRAHTNPRDADSDNDGIKDGSERAGTIVSLTDGVLTLTLFDGSTVSGTVDADTEVECAEHAATPPAAPSTPAPATATSRDHGDDNETESDDDAPQATAPTPAPAGAPTAPTTAPATGDDGPGHDQGDDGDDQSDDQGDDQSACGLADLVAGARVDEARIALTSAGKAFTKIELG